jgi:hypothetical protein
LATSSIGVADISDDDSDEVSDDDSDEVSEDDVSDEVSQDNSDDVVSQDDSEDVSDDVSQDDSEDVLDDVLDDDELSTDTFFSDSSFGVSFCSRRFVLDAPDLRFLSSLVELTKNVLRISVNLSIIYIGNY